MKVQPTPRGGGRTDRNSALRLVIAGEILLGRHGIEGASMRQIQLAAGSSNKFAVNYHFGGLSGLIDAILARRMPEVEVRQAEMLAAIVGQGQHHDIRSLVDAFFLPLLEQVDENGVRTYACFISALLRTADGAQHCRRLVHLTPTASRILALLGDLLPKLPAGILEERFRLLVGMVCSSVFNRICDGNVVEDARLVDDALDVAAAGLIRLADRYRTSGQGRGDAKA